MKKALFYKLFGVGKLPANIIQGLDGEGMLLFDEGLNGSVTYRNFHRPGKSAGYQRVGLGASIAVTIKRLAAYSGNAAVIDVCRIKRSAFEGDRIFRRADRSLADRV